MIFSPKVSVYKEATGFTLIELMLSLVLVVALLSMAFALMTGMLKLASQLAEESHTWILEQENQHFINQGFEQLPKEATLMLYQANANSINNSTATAQLLVVQAEQSNWGLNEQTNRAQTTLFEIRQGADGLLSLWLVFYSEKIGNFSNIEALSTALENQDKLQEFPLINSIYNLQWEVALNRLKDNKLEFFGEYLTTEQRPSLISLEMQQSLEQEKQRYLFVTY